MVDLISPKKAEVEASPPPPPALPDTQMQAETAAETLRARKGRKSTQFAGETQGVNPNAAKTLLGQ